MFTEALCDAVEHTFLSSQQNQISSRRQSRRRFVINKLISRLDVRCPNGVNNSANAFGRWNSRGRWIEFLQQTGEGLESDYSPDSLGVFHWLLQKGTESVKLHRVSINIRNKKKTATSFCRLKAKCLNHVKRSSKKRREVKKITPSITNSNSAKTKITQPGTFEFELNPFALEGRSERRDVGERMGAFAASASPLVNETLKN